MTSRVDQIAAYLRRIPSVLGLVARNPALRAVELAFAAFNAAEWATWLALVVFAYGEGGATAAGLLAFAMLMPSAVAAPLLAVLPDRHRPGRVLAVATLAQGASTLALGIALATDMSTPVVVGLALLYAPTYTVTRPALAALVPTLARSPSELTAANVVSGWVESMSVLVAPIAAALLLGASGPGAVLLVFATLSLLSATLLIRVPGPSPAGSGDRHGALTEVSDGLRLLREEPEPRLLVLLLGAQFVGVGALDVLYVVLAVGVLGAGEAWSGYLNAAFGVGGVIGIAATVALVGRPKLIPALLGGLGVWAVALGVLAVAPTVVSAVVCLAAAGVGHVVVDVSGRTLLQRAAPSDLVARVFGVLEGLSMVGLALGSLLVPALVWVGGPAAALAGVALILPSAALLARRRLAEIDRTAHVPVVEIGLLRSMELFAALPPPTLESVARLLEPLTVEAGTAVVTQGEVGDRWYAIADGTLDVRRNGELLAELGRGQGFGEIALLRDVTRTATVTAQTTCSLFALEGEHFLEAITGHPHAVAEAERVVEAHLATH